MYQQRWGQSWPVWWVARLYVLTLRVNIYQHAWSVFSEHWDARPKQTQLLCRSPVKSVQSKIGMTFSQLQLQDWRSIRLIERPNSLHLLSILTLQHLIAMTGGWCQPSILCCASGGNLSQAWTDEQAQTPRHQLVGMVWINLQRRELEVWSSCFIRRRLFGEGGGFVFRCCSRSWRHWRTAAKIKLECDQYFTRLKFLFIIKLSNSFDY